MWSIVKFIKTKHVDVVPTSWLQTVEDKDVTFFPPASTKKEEIIKMIAKNKSAVDSWPKFDVKVLKFNLSK